MAVRAIIHCLPQIEPRSFHLTDVPDPPHIKTYSVNLALEIRSLGGATQEEDEAEGEALFRTICRRLEHVTLAWHHFDPVGGLPTSGAAALVEQVFDPVFDGDALCDWLKLRQPKTGRFWTTERNSDDNQAAVEASRADAFTLSRATASWDAPTGHRLHLSHLARVENIDGPIVILPYFGDTAPPDPAAVVIPAPTDLFNINYIADNTLDLVTCQTTHFTPFFQNSPLPTGPKVTGAIADPDIDANGFLRLNKQAEALSRFLDRFEARSSSLLAAGGGLVFSSEEELAALETRIGFGRDAAGSVVNWGPASWYAVARLTAALDPLILGLLQPGQADDDTGGPILAPLAVAILDALDAQREAATDLFDYEPKLILSAVRQVLRENCALAGAASETLLSRSIKHVFEIEPALFNQDGTVVAEQPAAALLPLLVGDFTTTSDGGGGPVNATAFLNKLSQGAAEILTVALSDFEQKLQDDAGVEGALLRLFDTVAFVDKDPAASKGSFASLLARKLEALTPPSLLHPPVPVPYPALLTGVEDGWGRYRAMLEGPFNGAEAVRRAAAGAAARILLTTANLQSAPSYPTVEAIRTLVERADYHSRRFSTLPAAEVFEPLAAALVVPAYGGTVPNFQPELERSYEVALDLEPLNSGRFVPDSSPQPLPIQIASGIDSDGLDAFANSFNGIGVAIRRLDLLGDDIPDRWAYANLADLTPLSSDLAPVRAALDPVMPAITDGRGTMFLNYDGIPFSDRPDRTAFEGDAYDKSPTFYDVSPHQFGTAEDFAKLPRLAYGRSFESFSFVTTNAGTIPLALQQSARAPWMPHDQIEILFDGSTDPLGKPWEKPTVLPYDCSRRTAISQMSIMEDGDPRQPGRIGRELPGVMPLSKDYPRLGTVARPLGAGTIDLFRDTDGIGRVVFPLTTDGELSWKWSDFRASGPTGAISVRVFDGPAEGPDDSGLFEIAVPADISAGDFELRLRDMGPDDVSAGMTQGRWVELWVSGRFIDHVLVEKLADIRERHCWVRIVVMPRPGGRVSVSLADPDGQRPGGQGAPLLLLAPPAGRLWQRGLDEPVTTVISTPRVGYADFTRWMANSGLADQAYGAGGQTFGNGFLFSRCLAAANRMRHLDKRLGQYLDTLPDPAVRVIALELQVTDQLSGAPLPPDEGYFTVPALHAWLSGVAFPDLGNLTPKDLIERIFKPLDEHYRFTVSMAPATGAGAALDKQGDNTFRITVPSGSVARFAMHALVPLEHFSPQFDKRHPPVMDPGLLQYATRHLSLYAGFEAGVRLIECMYDGIDALTADDNRLATSLAASQIYARQIKDTRRYDLTTKPDIDARIDTRTDIETVRNSWRLLSEIDVTTQRWRATGRPMYHYIAPRDFALEESVEKSHPAQPLAAADPAALSELDRFEREAFFDRADADAHTVTQRLLPLKTSTTVQEFPWDAPGATYFRHRFTLRSRYAGALSAKQTAAAWRTKKENLSGGRSNVWTKRVAMLADRSRLTLTRPQLRGLIPLTSTPAASDTRLPAPPVAAVLQEPPYSRGGLADRIASEIRTGFGYGFDKDLSGNPVDPVKIQDSRKEIGPNPHLDYRPFPKDRVHSMALQSEGPLGLTFDPTESSAPALANSMVLLRPIALDGTSEPPLQESLAAVSMRRYVDPAWLSGVPLIENSVAAEASISDISRCWWIEFDHRGGHLSYALDDAAPVDIVEIARDNDFFVVSVWKGPIDGGVGESDLPVEIGRFRATRGGRPTLLHQETTPGNNLVSILVESGSSRTQDGEANVPVTLCSFEWSLPRERITDAAGVKPAQQPRLIVRNDGGGLTIWETMASAATALRWTQISRDFDYVSVFSQEGKAGDRPKSESIRFDRLRAKVGGRAIAFETKGNNREAMVCRTTTGNPYPAHVHRHVAMISSSFVGELGRSVEKFGRAALSVQDKPRFAVDAKGPEHALRVIEFETPAAIVCAKNVQAPAAYRTAYFDFIRTGYAKGNALLLSMRFVGSRDHLKSFRSVSFELSQRDWSTPVTVKHAIGSTVSDSADAPVVGAPVTLHALIDGGSVRSWIVYEDRTGEVITTTLADFVRDPDVVPGFWMTLTTEPSALAEFWADVSLLHGPIVTGDNVDPRSIGFDFNWLFSTHEEGDPAALVSAKGLSEMVEAQARIVTVSPPIPLSD